MGRFVWHSADPLTDLERSLGVYEPFVWISGAIVLLGVVLEIVADRRSDQNTAHFLKKWGEYLLIFGLVGEIAFGIATSVLSGLIIAKLHLSTAKAEEHTAELQSLLGPRHLTEEQLKKFRRVLASYPNIPIDVFVLPQENRPSTEEATAFGKQIVDVLAEYMDVSANFGLGCQPVSWVGVMAGGPPDMSRDRFAIGEILKFFDSEGIGVAVPYVVPATIPPCPLFSTLNGKSTTKRTGRAKINIIVGRKPVPILK